MSKYKLVEVFVNGVWKRMNAFHINNDGSAFVVEKMYEQLEDTYNVSLYNTLYVTQCREIKEPTWKPFPNKESIKHLKDCWFRNKVSGVEFKCTMYDSGKNQLIMKFGNDWWTLEDLFDYCEVQFNGEWQPVGVKDEL